MVGAASTSTWYKVPKSAAAMATSSTVTRRNRRGSLSRRFARAQRIGGYAAINASLPGAIATTTPAGESVAEASGRPAKGLGVVVATPSGLHDTLGHVGQAQWS